MFRSLPDHHQGVYAFLLKVTELKYEYSCVVMRQHKIQCIYVMFGVVRCADCTPQHTKHHVCTIYNIFPHYLINNTIFEKCYGT
jgi:hypothetical protein